MRRPLAGSDHPLPHVGRARAGVVGGRERGRDTLDAEVDVDPVAQWTGQPAEIAANGQRRTRALRSGDAVVPAGARVRRQHELEPGGEARSEARPVDLDRPGLEGLPERVERVPGELSRLIEEAL